MPFLKVSIPDTAAPAHNHGSAGFPGGAQAADFI
jgi:hypothetical protein